MSLSPDPNDGDLSTVPNAGIQYTINAEPWRAQGGHGAMHDHDNPQPPESSNHQGYQEWLLVIAGISIFLAPIVIVSGMAASHSDNWKGTFVGFFSAWLVMCAVGLFLDLRHRPSPSMIKRCLWHLGCCIASLWFFNSIINITSDNLPQWLPTAIDCGLGASLGLQSIPASSRKRIGDYIGSVISSIFGTTQVNVHRGEEHLLPRHEPRLPSPRGAQNTGGDER